MVKDSPLLPGFPVRFGRPRKNVTEKFKFESQRVRAAPMQDLKSLLSPWINFKPLKKSATGQNSRDRVYDQTTTFLAYLLQLLNQESCLAAVKRVQSWRKFESLNLPSSSTGAYCRARSRLPKAVVKRIFDQCVNKIDRKLTKDSLWHGRRVKVVDGTALSMPDTKLNQTVWPQNGAMKEGCGFPQLNLVGLFCLTTGALLKYATGSKYDGELGLWNRLLQYVEPGDLILGDRAYDNYGTLASLKVAGADGVFRLKRYIHWSSGQTDQLVSLTKTSSRCYTEEEWAELPDEIQVRVVKLRMKKKGYRPEEFYLITTITDPTITPENLAAIYLERWNVELFFRDIKTSLGMEILRSKKARLVEKEVQMYAILYNIIRGMMYAAGPEPGLSFKSSLDHFRNWLWLFMQNTKGSISKMLSDFYENIRNCRITQRPGRSEPRCKKRRPKPYSLMNKPRRKMTKRPVVLGVGKMNFSPLK